MQTAVLLDAGLGYFTGRGTVPNDTDPTRALALGDADGDLDLALGKGSASGGAQNRLYRNDGLGNFGDATGARFPSTPTTRGPWPGQTSTATAISTSCSATWDRTGCTATTARASWST